jgi:hypothetical protein
MPKSWAAIPKVLALRHEGARNFLSAKIPCNPLKMLNSDERIQGNPSFSNPHERGLSRPNRQGPRKPKPGRSEAPAAPLPARKPVGEQSDGLGVNLRRVPLQDGGKVGFAFVPARARLPAMALEESGG